MTNPKLVPFHMPLNLIPKMDKQVPAYWTAYLWLTKERPLDYWWIASPMAIANRYDPEDPFASAQRPYTGEYGCLPLTDKPPSLSTETTDLIPSTMTPPISIQPAGARPVSTTSSTAQASGSTRLSRLWVSLSTGFRKKHNCEEN